MSETTGPLRRFRRTIPGCPVFNRGYSPMFDRDAAHYGKIHGPWEFIERGGMSINRIIFNPLANDVNLEDEQTVELSRRMGQ